MIRRPPRSTQSRSSAASDVYKRQHARSHPLDGELGAYAYHRVVRPGHARVGDGCGATREHTRIVGLHMRVRAEHGGHASVEPASEPDLLAGGLGVEVDEHDGS